jgi:hypothetical protein
MRDLPDRHRGRAASHQKKVRRHIVELDPHRDALRRAVPEALLQVLVAGS